MARVIDKISEQVALIGKRMSMVGIITRTVPSADFDRPAIIILNTGIIHRVGHHRMYVDLSRTLARVGYTILRFDLSGIGDSERRGDLPPWQAVFGDIGEVLDWMESSHGFSRFVLVGLCSGADYALYYGSSDPRVVGQVLMDTTIPPTMQYYLHYFGRRLFRLRSWLNAALGRSRVSKRFAKLGENLFGAWRDAKETDIVVDPGSRAFFEKLYLRSVAIRTQFLIVLTAGQDTRHSYSEQILDAFPNVSFDDLLRLEFFDDCDHTFSFESDRARLTDVILGWINEAPFSKAKEILREHSSAALLLVGPALFVRLSTAGLLTMA